MKHDEIGFVIAAYLVGAYGGIAFAQGDFGARAFIALLTLLLVIVAGAAMFRERANNENDSERND